MTSFLRRILFGSPALALVKQGRVDLARIHHRQTQLFVMRGRIDAGVALQSEAEFQEQVGRTVHRRLDPSR
jgi:hypothetical protein